MMEDEAYIERNRVENIPDLPYFFYSDTAWDLLSQEISLQNTGTNWPGQPSAEQRESSAGQKRRERN